MDIQPCDPDEAFARDLVELNQQLDDRIEPPMPEKTISLIGGLLAGMTHVGRPPR